MFYLCMRSFCFLRLLLSRRRICNIKRGCAPRQSACLGLCGGLFLCQPALGPEELEPGDRRYYSGFADPGGLGMVESMAGKTN